MLRKLSAIAGAIAVAGIALVAMFTNHSYVTTPSMYPTIPPGSMIFVEPQHHYRVGEVIEFRANGLMWAHRLIAIKANGDFVTKGDNPENSPDLFMPAVTAKDVVGAVVSAPRWIGFPELIVHHPGYGLSWLRAELGIAGRVMLIVMAAMAALLPVATRDLKALLRRRREARSTATRDSRAPLPL